MVASAVAPTFTDADLALAAVRIRRRQQFSNPTRPWSEIARPAQLPPPGDWRFWLLKAGRGFGKTRTAAEYVCDEVKTGRANQVMLIAATTSDVRDVVVEGPSGIIKVAERIGLSAHYEPSKQRVTFSTGAVARTRSADEPDRIRGPECDLAWWDEFGTWKHRDAFTNADFGLRRPGPNGERSRVVVSFTPKPTTLVREIVKRDDSVITGGSTMENAANLDAATLASYRKQYEGTRLGRQELEGELLEDVEGALWSMAQIDATRIDALPEGVSLSVVVVGVDPEASSNENSAETGIVVVARGDDGRGYVLADYSIRATPNVWGGAAIQAYDDFQADHVTPETNNGGEMVTSTLQTIRPTLPIHPVHASRGKATRAEPISALYEQGRMHHIGTFTALEDQMTTWVPGMKSPDRMDALVWAATDVMLDGSGDVLAVSGELKSTLDAWFEQ